MERKEEEEEDARHLSYKGVKGEVSFRDDPPGAVNYVPLSEAMIHLPMETEEGSTHANSDGFEARLVR